MIVELNTLIELGFLMKTWFSSLVFKCISLRIIWIIQWSLTWRVRTLVFFFTLSCMAAKCGDPLSEMNLKKRVQGVLITSCTLIWEAAVVIVFRFFFDNLLKWILRYYNFGCTLNLFFNYLLFGNDDSLIIHL